MKVNVASRMVLLVGWVLLVGVLVGCGGNAQTQTLNGLVPMELEEDTETVTEAAAEEEATEEEEVLEEATRAVTNRIETVNASGDSAVLGNFPIEISLDGLDFLEPGGGEVYPSEAHKSTAYYFLRDRSKSVYEVCGEGHYTSAMKDIPDLIFRFFENDPTVQNDDIFIGLGAFPNKGKEIPTVLESLKLTEIDQIDPDDWDNALDNTWTAYDNVYDAAVFKQSITEAVAALTATKAERQILVVFGDSMLDYPGGDSEWNTLMPDTDGVSPLTTTLKNKDDDVELHYVQYDCLPDDATPREIEEYFWEKGISNWQKLQSKEDLHDIEQIDDEILVVNDHISVYGWKWYGNSIHKERVLHNLEPPKPPAWHVPSLMWGLLGDFLRNADNLTTNIWSQQRFITTPNVEEMEIPIPGYAASVTVHTLGFDDNWCAYLGWQGERDCDSEVSTNGNLVHNAFQLAPGAPNGSCEGKIITLSPKSYTGEALKYPMLVWWEINPIPLPRIVGEIRNVGFEFDGDSMVTVPSRTTVDLYTAWDRELTPEEQAYLDNCYLVNIVPSGMEPDITSGVFTLPRNISLSFDPGTNPTLGFDLALDVVVDRKIFIPPFTERGFKRDKLIGDQSGLPVIHFEYAPTLAGPATFEGPEGDSNISYTIPVLYTGSNYYPAENAPGAPKIYVLKKESTTQSGKCYATTKEDDPLFIREAEKWRANNVEVGNGLELLVDGRITKPTQASQAFGLQFRESEVEECGYEYVLITWENEAVTPIVCTLEKNECEQTSAFALSGAGKMEDED